MVKFIVLIIVNLLKIPVNGDIFNTNKDLCYPMLSENNVPSLDFIIRFTQFKNIIFF